MNTTPQENSSQSEKKPAQSVRGKNQGQQKRTRPQGKQRPKPQKATEEKSEGLAPSIKASGAKSAPQKRPQKKSQNKANNAQNAKKLRVIPLGGLDGIGKNMTAFEYGDDMIVVDAGLMFPDDDHPGVDLILPDYSYIIENQEKLRAILITHGHEDHTGALPYLIKDLEVKVPIVATKLTLGLIKGKLEERKLRNQRLHEIKAGDTFKRGDFSMRFIAMNHSIPDGVAIFIKTPVGNILHTGDFKFDQTPIDGVVADFGALAEAGKQGVMLLMSDSTNAVSPGFTQSEAEVGKSLAPILATAKGKVIVASFSSHIHRLQQVCDAAIAAGRKVVVTGRSMVQNTKIARELGYLHIDDENIVDAFDLKGYSPKDIVVLCTGSQGEPLSALSRMAAGEHRSFSIEKEDTVVISATPVPGNEKAVSNVVNMLMKSGANVYDKHRARVHVSGHAGQEELKFMLNITKPEYFMPIHGEAQHLIAHKQLAEDVGIPSNYIFVLENGDVLEFDEKGAVLAESVPNGIIYVDGLNVGDMDNVVLRDRQHLSQDGIVTIVLTINKRKSQLIGTPEIVSRGVVFPEGEDFATEVGERATKTLERVTKDHADLSNARRSVRDSVSQLIWERTKRRPMVIPVIIEV